MKNQSATRLHATPDADVTESENSAILSEKMEAAGEGPTDEHMSLPHFSLPFLSKVTTLICCAESEDSFSSEFS